jgi:squalene synthase HpnC
MLEVSQFSAEMGYEEALHLAKKHYENFPVISFLLPSALVKHVAVVYWFARTADDFADEGNITEHLRLENLNNFENRLQYLIKGKNNNDLEEALHQTIKMTNINPTHFYNLLKAFKQDVTKKRYSNFEEVLEYCTNSANPVGSIILELLDVQNENAFYYSDKICTALQLTNFLQDTIPDFEKGRIYLPKDEMDEFEVSEKMFELKENNLNLKKLVEFNVNRIQSYFNEGKGLLNFLSGKIRYEIDWTIRGGEEILKKIRGSGFDVISGRPVLSKVDYIKLFIKSILHL